MVLAAKGKPTNHSLWQELSDPATCSSIATLAEPHKWRELLREYPEGSI